MGTSDGSIIATIITIHIATNDAAAPGHVRPGIRIHAIDIVQPPGIGMPPIADMDAHQTTVTAALAAKNSAETPRKARWDDRSNVMRHALAYSSWRRHQTPVSLRPFGARSSHWYMPQTPSTPRSNAE